MSDERYAFYQNDLAYPGQSNRMEVEGDIDGWYRIGNKTKDGPKAKHKYPVVIWHDGSNADAWVQVGQSVPFLLNSERGLEFQTGSWLSCEAVEDKQYQQAILEGVWWDGRAARKPPAPQPTEEGGSAAPEPPSNSDAAEDIEFWEDELEALKEGVDALPPILDTEVLAKRADSLYQRLRKLWGKVDARRKVEKEPHDTAAAAVQAKYKGPLLDPAEAAAKLAKGKLDNYLREQERLQRAEQEELRQREAAARAKLNMAPAERPVTLAKPKVESGDGIKATSLRTTYVGVIEDEVKFIRAISKRSDFQEFLQTTANALARAKVPTKGMRIEERR
jgi:hypothetical protein